MECSIYTIYIIPSENRVLLFKNRFKTTIIFNSILKGESYCYTQVLALWTVPYT
jgi:hypothetical protein